MYKKYIRIIRAKLFCLLHPTLKMLSAHSSKKVSIPVALALTGICLVSNAQDLYVQRTTLDLGEVAFRNTTLAEFDCQNIGTTDLIIADAHPACGCMAVEYPHDAIAPGKKFKISVLFDAKQLGHFEKNIEVSTQTQTPTTIDLWIKGHVVTEVTTYIGNYPYKLGELETETQYIEFEDVNFGDRPQKYFHVLNPTNREAVPYLMHLPEYLKAEVSPTKIKPGQTALVTLTLDSHLLRDFGLTSTNIYMAFTPGDQLSTEIELPVSAVLLPNFNNLTKEELEKAPHMEISANRLSITNQKPKGFFKKLFGSKMPTGKVTITNTGKSNLILSNIQMFTDGMLLSINKTVLAPGEMATMKISIDQEVIKKAKTTPRVLVITNDPQQPKTEITIE